MVKKYNLNLCIKYIVIFSIILVLVFVLKFKNLSFLYSTPENWVTFVDYFSGIINPTIAILNLIIFIKLTLAVQKSTENNSWVEKAENLSFALIETFIELSTYIKQTGISIDKITNEQAKQEYLKSNQIKISSIVTEYTEKIARQENSLRIYIDSGIFKECESQTEFLSAPQKVIDRMNTYLSLFDGKPKNDKILTMTEKHNEFENELKNLLKLAKKFSDEIYKI